MKIKRIRVFGFKTFADRTEFDIDADLIAIVGPNGCGKSNVVDAILWGLGEPNARHLRAATSQDVIFNGSAKRKALGFAEVTLVFDNEDGTLPIASAEVAITRRLARSGESHFSINKRTCRLKDIYDLLADSGLGRSGYAIVGQREIDQALSASAEDRRAWLDEAAGVQRFRSKRTDALKRLAESDQHMERLTRLRDDFDTQRAPLEEEAKLAEEYVRLREALQQIETGLLAKDLLACDRAMRDAQQRIAAAQDAMARENELSERVRIESRVLGESIAELERKQDALRELRQSMLTQSERAHSAHQLAQQRLQSLSELEGNLATEQQRLDLQAKEAEEDAQIASNELKEDEALLNEVREAGTASDAVLGALQRELDQLEAQLQAANLSSHERTRLIEQQRAGASRLRELQEERQGIVDGSPDVREGLDEANQQVAKLDADLILGRTELTETQAALQKILDQVTEIDRLSRQVLGQEAALEGRRRGLEATLETLEGLGQGAQAVMNLVRHGDLEPVYTPVAQAIDSPHDLALAIETALGGSAHDLIVPSDRDAKAAIELLKARRLGRATFQPLNLVRPLRNGDARVHLGKPGVIGLANELVETPEQCRPVIDSLLGRTLLIETLDHALALAKTTGWSKVVTLEGEVVHGAGAVSGGKSNRQGSGLVQRKADLRQLEDELDALKQLVQQHEQKKQTLTIEAEDLRKKLPTHEAAIAALQTELHDAQSWARKLEDEFHSTEREAQRIDREIEKCQAILSVVIPEEVEVNQIQERRDALLAEVAKHGHAAQLGLERIRELQTRIDRTQKRLQEAQKRIEETKSRHERRDQRHATIDQDRAALQASLAEHEEARQKADAEAQSYATELEGVAARRTGALQRSLELSEQLRKHDETIRALQESLRNAEIERARAESKRANAAQRLIEEYGLEPDIALEEFGGLEIPEDAQSVVSKLKRDLKALGHPNLGAIEAFARLTERWTELVVQLEDLESSRKEIDASIAELDHLTRDRFLDAFQAVNEQFGKRFQQLFGGGEANLSLTDALNPLTSGVEIELVIPGKKKQRLELLSGGERSLCGCAFLFALLSVKPSPLVVLDEVDAPLDGRNVERYIEVLKSFRGITQFMVITHNPVTIEAAPVWFGVTMREPGVTTVLPYTAPEQQTEVVQAVVHDAFLEPVP